MSARGIGAASALGAAALAGTQALDKLLTGRAGSETPIRALESLTGRQIRGSRTRLVLGYAVQSTLAPTAAAAAVAVGEQRGQRFAAGLLATLGVVGIVNPTLGASSWPSYWTVGDWTRELSIKSVLALVVVATLDTSTRPSTGPGLQSPQVDR